MHIRAHGLDYESKQDFISFNYVCSCHFFMWHLPGSGSLRKACGGCCGYPSTHAPQTPVDVAPIVSGNAIGAKQEQNSPQYTPKVKTE